MHIISIIIAYLTILPLFNLELSDDLSDDESYQPPKHRRIHSPPDGPSSATVSPLQSDRSSPLSINSEVFTPLNRLSPNSHISTPPHRLSPCSNMSTPLHRHSPNADISTPLRNSNMSTPPHQFLQNSNMSSPLSQNSDVFSPLSQNLGFLSI